MKLKKLIDVDVFTFLARPRSAKYKRKMEELSERIKAEFRPVLTPARLRHSGGDAKWEIGQAAEKIHQCLKQNGNTGTQY